MRRRDFFHSMIGTSIVPPIVRGIREPHHEVATSKGAEQKLCCSFCRKQKTEVRKIIAGPACFICNECIEVCNLIIADKLP